MPKKMIQLTVRDKKLLAYDERSDQLFLVTMEPIDIETLEKNEITEIARFVMRGAESDAVI
jgi:hypothetical protein